MIVEGLEVRALLSLTIQTHPVANTISFADSIGPIFPRPDGNLWFGEQDPFLADPEGPQVPSGGIGKVTPSGAVTLYHLDSSTSLRAVGPGPDGDVWIVESTVSQAYDQNGRGEGYVYTNSLVRTAPDGGMTQFVMPASINVNDFDDLLTGPDGDLWLISRSGTIVKATTAGDFTVVRTGTGPDFFTSTVFGPDGNLWVGNGLPYGGSAIGFPGPAIDRITPDGAVTRFALPPSIGAEPTGLTVGPDGNIWFVSGNATSVVSKISTSGTLLASYPTPANQTIISLTSSPVNNDLWFMSYVQTTPPSTVPIQLGHLTTGGVFTLDPLQSQANPITFGPGGNLWFFETLTNGGTVLDATPAFAEVDFTPLTVTSTAYTNGTTKSGATVTLSFSAPVDPTTATDLDAYTLELVRATRHGVVPQRRIPVASAGLDATGRTVTLKLTRRLNPLAQYTMTVDGASPRAVADVYGEHLSGAGTGHPGTNFIGLVRRVSLPRVARKSGHA